MTLQRNIICSYCNIFGLFIKIISNANREGFTESVDSIFRCIVPNGRRNGQNQLRRAKPRLVIEHICGFLTGHEISKTEFGYGGRGTIDRNCRWCDKSIQIPKSENVPSEPFKGLMNMFDEGQQGTELE